MIPRISCFALLWDKAAVPDDQILGGLGKSNWNWKLLQKLYWNRLECILEYSEQHFWILKNICSRCPTYVWSLLKPKNGPQKLDLTGKVENVRFSAWKWSKTGPGYLSKLTDSEAKEFEIWLEILNIKISLKFAKCWTFSKKAMNVHKEGNLPLKQIWIKSNELNPKDYIESNRMGLNRIESNGIEPNRIESNQIGPNRNFEHENDWIEIWNCQCLEAYVT